MFRTIAAKVTDRWLTLLKASLPVGLRTALSYNKSRIVLRTTEEGLDALLRVWDGTESLVTSWTTEGRTWRHPAFFAQLQRLARDRPVDLEVPGDLILEQEVVLPKTAAMNLNGALTYGLSTWSPFSPDEVYVAGKIVAVKAQRVSVGLRYGLRNKMGPFIALAQTAGLSPDRLAFDPEGAWTTALQPHRIRRLRRGWHLDGALVASAVALICGLIGLLLMRQTQELTLLQSTLRVQLDGIRSDEQAEQSLKDLASRQTVVARKAATEPRLSELLAAVGRKLSPSMSVARFDLASGEGRIEIDGASGPEVLQVLRTVDMIASPKLEASPPGGTVTVIFTHKMRAP